MKIRLVMLGLFLIGLIGAVVIMQRPADPRQQFEAAWDSLEQADTAQSVQATISRLSTMPDFKPHAALLRAKLLAKSREYRQSLDAIKLAPPEGELRPRVLLTAGECYYGLKDFPSALQCFTTVRDESPDLADTHRWLGAIYYDLGAMNEAVNELKTVADLDKNDPRPHRLLGLIYSDVEQFGESIAAYQKCLERSPAAAPRTEIALELAHALVRERRYQDALNALADLDSGSAKQVAIEAECLWSLGRVKEARQRLADSEFSPTNRDISLIDARIRIDAGESSSVLEQLQALVDSDPHDHAARFQLAQAYRGLGMNKAYEAELKQVERTQALRQQLTRLNTQAILKPLSADIRDQLAETCEQLGKDELAAMWRQAAKACREMTRGD